MGATHHPGFVVVLCLRVYFDGLHPSYAPRVFSACRKTHSNLLRYPPLGGATFREGRGEGIFYELDTRLQAACMGPVGYLFVEIGLWQAWDCRGFGAEVNKSDNFLVRNKTQ